MFLILGVFVSIFVYICLWLGVKYILLLKAKRDADKSLTDIYYKLQQQYEAIISLFSQFHILSLENRNLLQNTKKLISLARDFSIEKDGNERIIGYANSILENVQIITDSVLEKEPENDYIMRFRYLQAVFNRAKDEYNVSAQKLKHYVDTFPASFFARLKNIRTMDFFI